MACSLTCKMILFFTDISDQTMDFFFLSGFCHPKHFVVTIHLKSHRPSFRKLRLLFHPLSYSSYNSFYLSLQGGRRVRDGWRERRDDGRERRLLHAQEGLAAQDHPRQGQHTFMSVRGCQENKKVSLNLGVENYSILMILFNIFGIRTDLIFS